MKCWKRTDILVTIKLNQTRYPYPYLGWETYHVSSHKPQKRKTPISSRGPGSLVGIATGYRLDAPGIEPRWGAKFSAPVQNGPGAHPAFCTMGTGSFPGVKSGRAVTLTPHPLLEPWSWKSKAIPLLPLWAVRPVQSLSACTRVHFTFFFYLEHGSTSDVGLELLSSPSNPERLNSRTNTTSVPLNGANGHNKIPVSTS
jgi:hypothetical protein